MDWDSSREYDSQTFSEDYNLHGASERSMDHPSVTRDDNHFKHALEHIPIRGGGNEEIGQKDDDDSIDMNLIADIVDGKPPRFNTYQRRGGVPQRNTHQTDENSVTSLVRYVMEGSQDPLDIDESPVFNPTRPGTGSHHGQQQPLGDEANEDHFRDWSTANIKIPKASPFARRSQLPSRQASEIASNRPLAKHSRGVSIDEGYRSVPARRRSESGTGQGTPPVTFALGTTKTNIKSHSSQPAQQQPKPIYRSAMKPPGGTLGANNQTSKKQGRRIQLPTELLDGNHDNEDVKGEGVGNNSIGDKGHDRPPSPVTSSKKAKDPLDPLAIESNDIIASSNEPAMDVLASIPVSVSVPGPARFTRISKANISSSSSPGKKLTTTIPTPQDTPEDDGNKEVQKSVKEMKALLRKLGLMPLSATLEAALEGLDAGIVQKGGLCEMMGLVQKLGAMCEKQKEVIHQMTDQIIEGDSHRAQQPMLDTESQEKIQILNKQLAEAKGELDVIKKTNKDLELDLNRLRQSNTADDNNQQRTDQALGDNTVETSSHINSSRDSADAVLSTKIRSADSNERNSTPTSKSYIRTTSKLDSSSEPIPVSWRQHIQKIEQEVEALKNVLEHSTSIAELKKEKETLRQLEDLEDQLYDALLENRRLQVKNKSLARELLDINLDHVEDQHKSQFKKQEIAAIKDIMVRLGVAHPQQVIPALDEIERVLQDVPRQRRFIAKTEKIIWESEIQDGTVRVQRHSQPYDNNSHRDMKNSGKGQDDMTVVGENELPIKPGRTCSQGYEATLQRLREWSELLDVLNHVEFADDFDDNATVRG
ncbi:hypothetical protein FBU30_006732 [Linnemannia zychae]|nr:hypothetical protein FBU30_006732 [Linnemannia zychae]